MIIMAGRNQNQSMKNEGKGRNNEKNEKKIKPTHLLVMGVIVVSVVMGVLFANGTLKIQTAEGGYTPTTTPTTFTFKIYAENGTVLDGNDLNPQGYIYLYSYEVSDWDEFDQADYDALAWDDYSYEKVLEHNDVYTIDADKFYIYKANCTGFGDYWSIPVAGNITIRLQETPDYSAITAIGDNGATTLNQTDQLYWTLYLNFNDAENQTDSDLGYKPHYDYSQITRMDEKEDTFIYNVLVITFNTTSITDSLVKISGITKDKVLVRNSQVEIYTRDSLTGANVIDMTLNENALGITAEIISAAFATGAYGETLTTVASC
jgi:hypothetical protein